MPVSSFNPVVNKIAKNRFFEFLKVNAASELASDLSQICGGYFAVKI